MNPCKLPFLESLGAPFILSSEIVFFETWNAEQSEVENCSLFDTIALCYKGNDIIVLGSETNSLFMKALGSKVYLWRPITVDEDFCIPDDIVLKDYPFLKHAFNHVAQNLIVFDSAFNGNDDPLEGKHFLNIPIHPEGYLFLYTVYYVNGDNSFIVNILSNE